MSRRFISEPRKPTVETLRYRISPIDKQFDKLDGLCVELERIADTLEPETYHEYYDILSVRRVRLEAKRQRELGNVQPRVIHATQATTAAYRPVQRHKRAPTMSPVVVKVACLCMALILFKIFT